MKEWLRNRLMYLKFCMSRTIGYVSIINSGMLLYLVLSERVDWGLEEFFIPIFALGFFSIALLGWIEIKYFKGYDEETRIAFIRNPLMMDVRNKVYEINDKVNCLNCLNEREKELWKKYGEFDEDLIRIKRNVEKSLLK